MHIAISSSVNIITAPVPSPVIHAGMALGEGTGAVMTVSYTHLQPHSRTFRAGNFFRGEDGSGTGDGIFAGEMCIRDRI